VYSQQEGSKRMSALEFWASVNADQTLTLPPDVAAKIEREQRLRVILIVPDDDDRSWERLTAEQFLEGYAPSDAIYDELPVG
jgi:hypothetical protein